MSQRDIEIDVEIHAETDLAYLVYDGKVEVWIPKSQITDYSEERGVITSIFISEWLATQKGLT